MGLVWERAVQLLTTMAQIELELDAITFSAVISACEKSCEWENTLQLFGVMSQNNVESNAIIFNAVISAWEKGGHPSRLLSVLRSPLERVVAANPV